MSATPASALFSAVPLAPSDPILGVTEAFLRDPNPRKVNLGQGLYYSEDGTIPLLQCVREAEAQYLRSAPPRGYLPSDGLRAYGDAVQQLVFGAASPAIVTLQTLGGTGALKVGADFLRRLEPAARVWISEPSWENHRQLFEAAGFAVQSYRYYDPATRRADLAGMARSLAQARPGDIVVLHGCCHNPTGADLDAAQWPQIAALTRERQLVPFVDLAYQGFGDGVDADAFAARLFARTCPPVFVASSFSKTFSLYGERVGALSIVAAGEEEADRVRSLAKQIVRTNYSNPPAHGAKLVAAILADASLRALWERELAGMRERIKGLRRDLARALRDRVPGADFSFILEQRGMFSYSGLTREQVRALRERFSIYAIDSGRICVPALNRGNLDYVAAAIAEVIR
ncbi:MAG TPA: amino acid aminotransferase [Burkholderiales bacterium]